MPVRRRRPKPLSARAPPQAEAIADAGASCRAETVEAACNPSCRSVRGCGAPSQAEAVADAIRLTSGEGGRDGPDCPTTEVAVRPPRGPIHLTGRGRQGACRPPRWSTEAKSRCAALVMLRSAEADPHVTNRALRAGRQADLLRLRHAPSRGPKARFRRLPMTTLQSTRGLASRAAETVRPDPATALKHLAPSMTSVARRRR